MIAGGLFEGKRKKIETNREKRERVKRRKRKKYRENPINYPPNYPRFLGKRNILLTVTPTNRFWIYAATTEDLFEGRRKKRKTDRENRETEKKTKKGKKDRENPIDYPRFLGKRNIPLPVTPTNRCCHPMPRHL